MNIFNQQPCSRGVSTELQVENSITWNSNQTLLLIQLYRENTKAVESGKTRARIHQHVSSPKIVRFSDLRLNYRTQVRFRDLVSINQPD